MGGCGGVEIMSAMEVGTFTVAEVAGTASAGAGAGTVLAACLRGDAASSSSLGSRARLHVLVTSISSSDGRGRGADDGQTSVVLVAAAGVVAAGVFEAVGAVATGKAATLHDSAGLEGADAWGSSSLAFDWDRLSVADAACCSKRRCSLRCMHRMSHFNWSCAFS